jgi:tricorn protease interacting factor F2/3
MISVAPIAYHLTIEPDLDTFVFKAKANLRYQVDHFQDQILLNAIDLDIDRVDLIFAQQTTACQWRFDAAAETMTILLPQPVEGAFGIQIDYRAAINDRMAGFYRSAFIEGDRTGYAAVTQFQESDARRAFPCVDHPAAKAVFTVEMVVPPDRVAVSNTQVASQSKTEDGRQRVCFHPTPPMSTYLLFWSVGPWEIQSNLADQRVRTVTLPGRQSHTAFGLDFGRQSLTFCESYFNIPYPIAKMDLIGIPDFAFGAMENWGAITFRENLLLHHAGITSRLGEARICEVIAHEIVHQWFGNLVTPSDWRYLWLNESFATFFSYAVVDYYQPRWNQWHHFMRSQTESALNRDALCATYPIEIPGGEHVVINTSTAPLIYSKGASILRQIEGYIGKGGFQRGLRAYLTAHSYRNAESRHLWEAFEAASEKPVTAMMKSWIEQEGYPQIEVRRQGGRLFLSQRRFTCLPLDSDQRWMIPVAVRIFYPEGRQKRIAILMESQTAVVDIGANALAYKLNAGQTGFYRTRYLDDANLEVFGRLIDANELSIEDRWGVENDLFAFLRAGLATLDQYLTLAAHFEGETAFLPLVSLHDNLLHLYLAAPADRRSAIGARARRLLTAALDKLGMAPSADESHATSITRDMLLWHAAIFGVTEVAEYVDNCIHCCLQGQNVHPDIAKSVLQTAAFKGSADTLEWMIRALETSESEHERQNLLTAMGCFKDRALLAAVRDYVMEKVPDRNRFIPIGAMALNPFALQDLWPWFTANVQRLEKSHPLLYERIIAAIVPLAGMDHSEQIQSFLTDYAAQNPKLKDVVALSLEKLEINLRMRNRLGT